MVDAITSISSSAASRATQADSSLSFAEPTNAWVGARQSHITADLLARQSAALNEEEVAPAPHPHGDEVDADGQHGHRPQERALLEEIAAEASTEETATLSGESDRIGTMNFDDDTPFGERSAFL